MGAVSGDFFERHHGQDGSWKDHWVWEDGQIPACVWNPAGVPQNQNNWEQLVSY